MNCSQVRARLALFLYGDLSEAESQQVAVHLRDCPACTQEVGALQRVRQCLDAVPAPAATLNLGKLYHQAWEGERRRARRWRRVTAAVAGTAAAIILVVLAANVRVGWQDGQLTFAWGAVPSPRSFETPPNATPADDRRTAELDRRLETLADIVHALAGNMDAREQQQQADVVELRGRIQQLQQEIFRLRAAASLTSAERNTALVRLENGGPR